MDVLSRPRVPITALTPGAVRALGSAQVITTPVAVVKELVENALDAQASSIVVEISSNTLDCIQLKDNGYGVAPDDREYVAKRHFTSKIRDLTELKQLGGSSLGFRGEGLASAAEFGGSLELVTRVEGEVAARKLVFGREGQVLSRETVSHGVGTTVRIAKLFHTLPVRKEMALKNAPKTLQQTKELLQRYAMARPTVRFSLKVLKARNDKYNWIYAPKKNAKVPEAALSVVGKDVAAQCTFFTSYSMPEKAAGPDAPQGIIDISQSDSDTFHFEAFLPKSCADPSILSNKGHFISVDSRPVLCTKGALKQVLTLYKDFIRSAMSNAGGTQIKNPFICMNIVCPQGSYDPNIEAAKDDVLFEDQRLLLESVGAFFTRIFGDVRKENTSQNAAKARRGTKENAFELLLARKRSAVESIGSSEQRVLELSEDVEEGPLERSTGQPLHTQNRAIPEPLLHNSPVPLPYDLRSKPLSDEGLFYDEEPVQEKLQPRWRSNMYEVDEDYADEIAVDMSSKKTPSISSAKQTSERPHEVLDQLTAPQMNAPLQSPVLHPDPIALSSPDLNLLQDRSGSSFAPQHLTNHFEIATGAPQASIAFPPTPSSTAQYSRPGLAEALPRTQECGRLGEEMRARVRNINQTCDLIASSELDSPSSAPTFSGSPFRRGSSVLIQETMGNSHSFRGFTTARSIPLNGPSGERNRSMQFEHSKESSPVRRRGKTQKDTIASVQDMQRTWFDVEGSHRPELPRKAQNRDIREALASIKPPDKARKEGNMEFDGSSSHLKSSLSSVTMRPNLEEMLDYEQRKKLATKRRREILSHRDSTISFSGTHDGNLVKSTSVKSPHQNRYNAALAALHSSEETNTTSYSLAAGDPRGYLMRVMNQNSIGRQDSGRRPRTSLLPLESVSESLRLQNILLKLPIELASIQRGLHKLSSTDEYVSRGSLLNEAFQTNDNMAVIEHKLLAIIRTLYRLESGETPDLALDIEQSLRDHLSAGA